MLKTAEADLRKLEIINDASFNGVELSTFVEFIEVNDDSYKPDQEALPEQKGPVIESLAKRIEGSRYVPEHIYEYNRQMQIAEQQVLGIDAEKVGISSETKYIELNDDLYEFYSHHEKRYYSILNSELEVDRILNNVKKLGDADASNSGDNIWEGNTLGKTWVIKKLKAEDPKIRAVQALGINSNFPSILDRSILYSEIAREKDFFRELVPDSNFGYAKIPENDSESSTSTSTESKVELVQLIEKVGGEKPRTARQWLNYRRQVKLSDEQTANLSDTEKEKLSDAEKGVISEAEKAVFARDLTRMQFLDYFMSQVDRQIGNYMVVTDGDNKVIGLKAIDNDFSFTAKKLQKLIEPKISKDEGIIVSGTLDLPLPSIADADTQAYFNSLTMDRITEVSKGRLTPTQLKHLAERLELIKVKLKEIAAEDNIIQNNDWTGKLADLMKGTGLAEPETYVALLRHSDKDDVLKLNELYKYKQKKEKEKKEKKKAEEERVLQELSDKAKAFDSEN